MKALLNRSKITIFATTIIAAIGANSASANTLVRLQSNNDASSISEGYALNVEEFTAQTNFARSNLNTGFRHQSQAKPEVWISDVGTLLFDDGDGDGYHSGFSVSLDVDSEYGDTEVYAKIYLEPSNGPMALLHQTSRFSIYGRTIGDEYRVDTELRANYEADNYNVIIDIHDAWSNQLLDTANARGFDNLKKLPLESRDLNQPHHADNDYGSDDDYGSNDQYHNDENSDVQVTEYAGAFNPLMLLFLAAGALVHRRRK